MYLLLICYMEQKDIIHIGIHNTDQKNSTYLKELITLINPIT